MGETFFARIVFDVAVEDEYLGATCSNNENGLQYFMQFPLFRPRDDSRGSGQPLTLAQRLVRRAPSADKENPNSVFQPGLTKRVPSLGRSDSRPRTGGVFADRFASALAERNVLGDRTNSGTVSNLQPPNGGGICPASAVFEKKTQKIFEDTLGRKPSPLRRDPSLEQRIPSRPSSRDGRRPPCRVYGTQAHPDYVPVLGPDGKPRGTPKEYRPLVPKVPRAARPRIVQQAEDRVENEYAYPRREEMSGWRTSDDAVHLHDGEMFREDVLPGAGNLAGRSSDRDGMGDMEGGGERDHRKELQRRQKSVERYKRAFEERLVGDGGLEKAYHPQQGGLRSSLARPLAPGWSGAAERPRTTEAEYEREGFGTPKEIAGGSPSTIRASFSKSSPSATGGSSSTPVAATRKPGCLRRFFGTLVRCVFRFALGAALFVTTVFSVFLVTTSVQLDISGLETPRDRVKETLRPVVTISVPKGVPVLLPQEKALPAAPERKSFAEWSDIADKSAGEDSSDVAPAPKARITLSVPALQERFNMSFALSVEHASKLDQFRTDYYRPAATEVLGFSYAALTVADNFSQRVVQWTNRFSDDPVAEFKNAKIVLFDHATAAQQNAVVTWMWLKDDIWTDTILVWSFKLGAEVLSPIKPMLNGLVEEYHTLVTESKFWKNHVYPSVKIAWVTAEVKWTEVRAWVEELPSWVERKEDAVESIIVEEDQLVWTDVWNVWNDGEETSLAGEAEVDVLAGDEEAGTTQRTKADGAAEETPSTPLTELTEFPRPPLEEDAVEVPGKGQGRAPDQSASGKDIGDNQAQDVDGAEKTNAKKQP